MINRPKLVLVACMANHRVIGLNNQMPWHLPEDLKHFKAVTLSKPIVMGRKTFDSIGRPLPGRLNIVVTRQADWSCEGVVVAHGLEEALELAKSAEEICIIGGANLYTQALPLADEMCLTHIDLEVKGDAYFPEYQQYEWQVSNQSEMLTSASGLRYQFVDYKKI